MVSSPPFSAELSDDRVGAGLCLHELFERQVAERPTAVALTDGALQLSYADLNGRANQVAHHLRGLGVRPDTCVGVALERGVDLVVAVLGVLKAGAAYLPLDPATPTERLAFVLGDAGVQVLVTEESLRGRLPIESADPVTMVVLDAERASIEGLPRTNIPVADLGLHARHLAYVIYTSGSTGQPKGVMVEHANVTRLFDATAAWYDFGPDDVWTLFHSIAFDFSVWELWGALLHGGRLVVVPSLVARSPQAFHALLCRERVTVLNQTPGAFLQLIAAQPAPGEAPEHALRYVIFGGEALELHTLRPWVERHGADRPQLVNMYGITETTVHVTCRPLSLADIASEQSSVIGRPLTDLRVHVLDDQRQPVPVGATGELYVGGAGVARGYLNRPELTLERFVDDPFSGEPGARLYKTGDLGRWRVDGELDYLGRNDHQIKLRGFRIEVGDIEAQLRAFPQVREAVVLLREDVPGDKRLVAYLTRTDLTRTAVASDADAGAATAHPAPAQTRFDSTALRQHLSASLPEYMIPSAFVAIDSWPLTVNGKLDRRALPAPSTERSTPWTVDLAPVGVAEMQCCNAFAAALGLDRVGRTDNFFELGGNSFLVLRALAALRSAAAVDVPVATFFQHPTPQALARVMTNDAAAAPDAHRRALRVTHAAAADEPIAVVAMAGRFPGASDIEAFWAQLCAGRDGITVFEPGTLDASLPTALTSDPSYVPARGVIDGVELFDAAFFGMAPGVAALTDPQQRIFLELCWECLERGGYAPDATTAPVGVFGGMHQATYFEHHVRGRPDLIEQVGAFQVMLGNEKDFLATRVAHRLNLTGPALSVNTACSTSLVAIAQAVTSLRAGQCDMALAGGVAIQCPPRSGSVYQEGAMLSADGRTRSFDAQAAGTSFSDGAAVLLLKRHSAAVADGDTVIALIRSVALNNDGRDKASFTAPSVAGQAAVIAAAHDAAGIDPRSISYVEAHGTATPLGDPIEVAALTQAFRRRTGGVVRTDEPDDVDDRAYCRLGSVKSNVGHLVTAAGAAGMIKTALALAHEQLPATLHFAQPNPHIDFAASPFIVCDRLTPWPRGAAPRRAGVSSFGVGGTNAHAVLEEAPLVEATPAASGAQLLLLSARTAGALDAMAARLAAHLQTPGPHNLADVAHTLQVGRSRFAHRLCAVADTLSGAVAALTQPDHALRSRRAMESAAAPALVWLFPGQGAQYAGMGRQLHAQDPVFRAALDEALAAVQLVLSVDLRARLFDAAADALAQTDVTQPALFCIEYALAQSWLARGARPAALIGHSVGEFVAAVIAGVMSLADAARLVALRGALMQAQPPGSMLSVRLPLATLSARLPADLTLAAENGPAACVVAGSAEAVAAFQAALEADGVVARRLQTSHAFHSPMMDAAVAPFEAEVQKIALAAPQLRIVSSSSGTWLTDAQATDPAYWARHLRDPVRFSAALRTALADLGEPQPIAFLEVGPPGGLATLARQHGTAGRPAPTAVATWTTSPEAEASALALACGQLWTLGIELAAAAASPAVGRRRVRLPTYPFERQRCWIDARPAIEHSTVAAAPAVPATIAPIAATAAVLATSPSTTSIAPLPAAATAHSLPLTRSSTAMNAALTASRRPKLVDQLRTVIEDVAGRDLSGADPSTSFVELGLDSLTLTQAATQVKRHFKVAVTFRQLMEQYRSLDTLAGLLDAQLPAEAPVAQAAPAVVAAAAPVAVQPIPGSVPATGVVVPPFANGSATMAVDGSVLQVVQQQMQLMAQQLALLGSGAGRAAQTVVQMPAQTPTQMPAQTAPATASSAAASSASALVPAAPPADAAPEPTAPMRYDVKKAFGAIARIHTTPSELTERQRLRLDTFLRRYVERTAKSKAYTARHRPHMADPRVVNGFRPVTKEIAYQIVVDRSKGARVWDLDGNEYVDVLNGFGMNMFGWQPDFVTEAVQAQLASGYEIGPQHPLSGEVCDLICELTGADRAALCNTGSEAVMAAIRIARTVTGRNTVVLFSGSYHGTFDEVLVRAGRGGKGIPAAPGIMAGAFGDVRVLDYGTPETLAYIRANADDLAAVVVEPVQSRRPDFQPREFLKNLRALTEEVGACLVFDEVITGFRTHLGGVQALYGIKADLATYGKVIGGGFPVGAVAGSRAYMDALDGGAWQYGDDSVPTVGVTYFAGTFVRHPLTLAAAKASLLHLKQAGPDLQTQLNLHTAAMADELTAFCREVGAPIEIRYFASLWRVSWLEDHPLQDLLFAMMRNRGVHILDNFPCFMTTAHAPSDIAIIKSAFKEAVAELQEAGLLPQRDAATTTVDPARPPAPNARLGRDKEGRPTWFVPDPSVPGKYVKV